MDVEHENNMEEATIIEEESTEVEPSKKAGGIEEYDPSEWSAPPKKCPETGRFLPGTGSSLKGGRPVGSKDKISRKLVDLCTDLVADKGAEMLEHLSRTDPAAAMAICLKVVPPEEMRRVFSDDLDTTQDAIQQINIRLVGKPTEQRLEPPQERLTAPLQRIEPSADDLQMVVEEGADMPSEAAPETPPEPTQADMDAQAAEAERERVRRQNETLRQYGGLTGVPSRSQRKGNGISYPDDGAI